ncbi:MAG TPA: hypothetical protein VFR86_08665 [Burkholderiaceae bacterium]|nr:hypothetical protein [Burkholderiaceae bacterium]
MSAAFTCRSKSPAAIAAGVCMLASLNAAAADSPEADTFAAPLYRLVDSATISAARWNPVTSALRFEVAAGLLPRHELRLSSPDIDLGSSAARQAMGLAGINFLDAPAATFGLDPSRATYRYTIFERWRSAVKVGITANLREVGSGLRAAASRQDHTQFAALPLLHVAGEGRLFQNWLWSVDADGLTTSRGRAFDLGLRVDYRLARDFSLFGGYRVIDATRDAEEYYGNGTTNAANVGMRLRF